MSRLGLFFCAPYALFVAACIGFVALGDSGRQGQFMFLHLPVAAQAALAGWLGLGRVLEHISWPDAYGLFMTPAFLLLYGAGALLERSIERRDAVPPERD